MLDIRRFDMEERASHNPVQQTSASKVEPFQFYAKVPQEPVIKIKQDSRHGFWYRPDVSGFGMNLKVLNEDNLRFVHTLIKYGQLNANPAALTREVIQRITQDLDYDSDLWDDIFENDEICRSVFSEEDIRKEQPNLTPSQVQKEKMKKSIDFYMNDAGLKRLFKNDGDPQKYIKSRIEVFKTYIYLRRCAILYRDTDYKQPLLNLINFLKTPLTTSDKKEKKISNQKWLCNLLRVEAVGLPGENWNSGLHEWLTCSQTLEAIERTAGLRRHLNVEPCLSECIWGYRKPDNSEGEYYSSEFNWLDLQLLLRTPNKYVIFRSRINTVENGHCGAVNHLQKPPTATTGIVTGETTNSLSEKSFHNDLNNLLHEATSINQFVASIQQKYEISIFHDKTLVQTVRPNDRRYLVDGTTTDNYFALRAFQPKLAESHRFFHTCVRDLTTQERIGKEATRLRSQTTILAQEENTLNFYNIPL